MLETHYVESRHLGLTRRVTVWLPSRPRPDRSGPYPVLYLNDGQNLFDPARAFAGNTWFVAETALWLVRERRIPPLVIVGIDHGGDRRAREYLPVHDDRNPTREAPLGRQYAEFVTREVMPFINRTYPVATGPSQTGLGGSSYGAVAALNTALIKEGVFGRLLLESPSLYVGGRYLLRRARAARRWPSRIYLGVGTAETSRLDLNEETVANVLALERVLRTAGLRAKRLRVVVEPGATHTEGAWARRLPDALQFLFGESTPAPGPRRVEAGRHREG
ncbi:MAG: alpha/beta hydrolase-fold protein [Acidobacteriota bacterium]